jgi:hypothetical protein
MIRIRNGEGVFDIFSAKKWYDISSGQIDRGTIAIGKRLPAK